VGGGVWRSERDYRAQIAKRPEGRCADRVAGPAGVGDRENAQEVALAVKRIAFRVTV
jgi:hypothetical protein